jgi:hypothetical protein
MLATILAVITGITTVYAFGKEILLPLYNIYQAKKEGFDFSGLWYSAFEPRDHALSEWIIESVLIRRNWMGKIIITTDTNYQGYYYKGTAHIGSRRGIKCLVGDWKSTKNPRRQDQASDDRYGKMMLVLLPDGVLMGSYTGFNRRRFWISGGWVLGRNKYSLELGKKQYQKGCLTAEDWKDLEQFDGQEVILTPAPGKIEFGNGAPTTTNEVY